MVWRCWRDTDHFFSEIDLAAGYITETVARRSGDLQIENITRPSARLPTCSVPPEAHEFDTPVVTDGAKAMTGNNTGLVGLLKKNIVNCVTLHFIIHQ